MIAKGEKGVIGGDDAVDGDIIGDNMAGDVVVDGEAWFEIDDDGWGVDFACSGGDK